MVYGIFLGKKAIIITSKHGTRIFFPITILLWENLRKDVPKSARKYLLEMLIFGEKKKLDYLKKKKKSSRNKDESQQWTLLLKRVTFGIWTPAVTSNMTQKKFGAEHVK